MKIELTFYAALLLALQNRAFHESHIMQACMKAAFR